MQKVLFFQTKLKLQNCATTYLRYRMKLVSHFVLPYDIIFTSPSRNGTTFSLLQGRSSHVKGEPFERQSPFTPLSFEGA